MKKLAYMLLPLMLLTSHAYSAAVPVAGNVIYAGIYGNGDVYVTLNAQINEPGCVGDRIDISYQSSSAKSVLATARLWYPANLFVF